MNKKMILAKSKIFRNLNGRDMNVFDYMQNASCEDFIVMLQEIFACNMDKKDIQKILDKKIVDIMS